PRASRVGASTRSPAARGTRAPSPPRRSPRSTGRCSPQWAPWRSARWSTSTSRAPFKATACTASRSRAPLPTGCGTTPARQRRVIRSSSSPWAVEHRRSPGRACSACNQADGGRDVYGRFAVSENPAGGFGPPADSIRNGGAATRFVSFLDGRPQRRLEHHGVRTADRCEHALILIEGCDAVVESVIVVLV